MSTSRVETSWPLVALGVSVSAFGAYLQFKLPPVLPAFLATYPHDADMAAGFMSVFAFIGLIASAPLGRLLDRRAMLGALVGGLGIAAIGVVPGLLVPQSGPLMLLARGIEGLTFAIFSLIGPVIANQASAKKDLGLVTGLIATWIPIGQLVAGLLALAGADWRALWLINLGLIVPLLVSAWAARRWLGPVNRAPKLATGDAAQTLRAARTDRALVIGAGIFLVWALQFFAFMTWLTKYLTGELHLSEHAAILAYLLPVIVIMLFNIGTGWCLARGLRLLPALIIALLMQSAVWLSAPLLNAAGLDGAFGVAMLVVYGIGAGVAPSCFFHLPHHLAQQGSGAVIGPKAYGVLMTGRNSGVFLGPILMAWLFQGNLGWTGAAWVIAAITASGALLALLLGIRRP